MRRHYGAALLLGSRMLKLEKDEVLVLGDIAGQHQALLDAVAAHPNAYIISVGDIVDRGPDSNRVIEWFMTNQERSQVIMGNHEKMMIDAHENPQYQNLWLYNGGSATMQSYSYSVPAAVLGWLERLPRCIELTCAGKKYFISHAFYNKLDQGAPSRDDQQDEDFLWARNWPVLAPQYHAQICGHEGKVFTKENGMCIDDSHNRNLGAIQLPTDVVLRYPHKAIVLS